MMMSGVRQLETAGAERRCSAVVDMQCPWLLLAAQGGGRVRYRELMHSHGNPIGRLQNKLTALQRCKMSRSGETNDDGSDWRKPNIGSFKYPNTDRLELPPRPKARCGASAPHGVRVHLRFALCLLLELLG
jgi:hypothetical protein